MASTEVTTRIAAPVERVFEVCTDFAGAPGRIKDIRRVEMLTDGPVRVGTRFRETRVMFGKEASEVMEVTGLDRPRSCTLAASSGGARYTFRFGLEPEGADATVLTVRFEVVPVSFLLKLMFPLAGLMMKVCSKALRRDIADIRAACEGPGTGPAAEAGVATA